MEKSKQLHNQKKDDMVQTHKLALQHLEHEQKLDIRELMTKARLGKKMIFC
jgi:hypothetical protein